MSSLPTVDEAIGPAFRLSVPHQITPSDRRLPRGKIRRTCSSNHPSHSTTPARAREVAKEPRSAHRGRHPPGCRRVDMRTFAQPECCPARTTPWTGSRPSACLATSLLNDAKNEDQDEDTPARQAEDARADVKQDDVAEDA